jgi:aryl-alcohol dehydrogenase-like predicted oxidoreductase
MEKLMDEGLIRWYGISSNSFPLLKDSPEFVSLARVWEVYEKACQDIGKTPEEGRLAVIQLPFNWIEHQGATLKNNEYRGEKYTVLELAQKLNLGVLINRPLNAILDGRILLRLARYGSGDYRRQIPDEQNYQQVKHLEQRFDAAYPKLSSTLTFSQKALLLAAFVSGIDVVLNGMRTPGYVADSMKVMEISEDISLEKLLSTSK